MASILDVPTLGKTEFQSALRVPITGNGAVIYSDSNGGYDGTGQPTASFMGAGLLPQIAVQSKQRIQFRGVFAYPGKTTTEIASNLSTVLTNAPASATVFLLAGTNDASKGAAFTDALFTAWKSDYANLTNALLVAGHPVVVCLLPALTGTASISNVHRCNAFLRKFAEKRGLLVFDLYTPFVGADGSQTAGQWQDAAHFSTTGLKAIGAKGLAEIAPRFPFPAPVTAQTTDDPWNLVPGQKSLMTPNANGWSSFGTSKSLTLVAPGNSGSPSGLRGNWLGWGRDASSASDATLLIAQITAGFSVGERIAFSGRISTTGFETAASKLTVAVLYYNSTGDPNLPGLYEWQTDIADGAWYTEGVIPAGTTEMGVRLTHRSTGAGGATTVLLGEVTIRNLTRQAVVL